jgi:SAM-dependent methyltransferase
MNSEAADRESKSVASYEDIALEYYDHRRHPTCRDLRELSIRFLGPRLRAGLPDDGCLVEVGPGLSVLAPAAAATDALSRVILVDSSPRMLSYSSQWIASGARSVVASADATGLQSGTVSLIVSSLGDPYNRPGFWREVARLLKPGGRCLFTMPSFEWSSRFRSHSERHVAEFLGADGARLLMPSYVNDEVQQISIIEAAGLCVEERKAFGTELLDAEPAPKLLCIGPGDPVVSAYVVKARQQFP